MTSNNIVKAVIAFVKKNWKLLIIVAALIFIFFSIKSCNNKNQLIKDLKALSGDTIPNSTIKFWKDENGKLHEQVLNLQVGRDVLIKQKDSLASVLKISPKRIDAINYQGSALQLDEKLNVDTFPKKHYIAGTGREFQLDSTAIAYYDFEWKDKWIRITGTIGAHGDSVHIDGTDTLVRIDYTKRSWLLGPVRHYTDIYNSNPHIKLTGYKGLQFKENKTPWSLGLSLQYGYQFSNFNLARPQVSVGLSLQYSILRF